MRIERERSVLAGEPQVTLAQPAWERNVIELDRVSVAQLQREGREAGLTLAAPARSPPPRSTRPAWW